jgi:hypothetical protein
MFRREILPSSSGSYNGSRKLVARREINNDFPLIVAHLIGLFLDPEDGVSTFSEIPVIASYPRRLHLIVTAVRTSNLVYSEICHVYRIYLPIGTASQNNLLQICV